MSTISLTNTIDPSPTHDAPFYAVAAVDAAGNISAPSSTAFLDAELLPVGSLSVEWVDAAPPMLKWTSSSSSIQGYYVYAGDEGREVRLSAAMVSGLTYTDPTYNGDVRRYMVTAVDQYGRESLGRSVTLVPLGLAAQIPEQFLRGEMNPVNVSLANPTDLTLDVVRAGIAVGAHNHVSQPLTLQPLTSTVQPPKVVVGGYAGLPDLAAFDVYAEIYYGEVDKAIVRRPVSDFHVANATQPYTVTVETGGVVAGGGGNVRVSVVNNTFETVEFITATGSGTLVSPEMRVRLLDADGVEIGRQAFKQTTGGGVFNLATGQTVARIGSTAEEAQEGGPAHTWTSDWVYVTAPLSAKPPLKVLVNFDNIHYRTGEAEQVTIEGFTVDKSGLLLSPPPYTGQIDNINPADSFGNQPVVITGRAVESAGGAARPNVDISLILTCKGFVRRIDNLLTDSSGNFSYTFVPLPTEGGVYSVAAVHPTIREAAPQAQFVVRRLIISPNRISGRLPRNYGGTVRLTLTALAEAQATCLKLVPVGDLPTGVNVYVGDPAVALAQQGCNVNVAGPGKVELNLTVVGDNNAAGTGSLALRVVSNETTGTEWGQIGITYELIEAKPVVVAKPVRLSTGVAPGGSVTETITLENDGFAPVENATIELLAADGSPAPDWIVLGNIGTPRPLDAGQKSNAALGEGGLQYVRSAGADRAQSATAYRRYVQLLAQSGAIGTINPSEKRDITLTFAPDTQVPASGTTPTELVLRLNYGGSGSPSSAKSSSSALAQSVLSVPSVVNSSSSTINNSSSVSSVSSVVKNTFSVKAIPSAENGPTTFDVPVSVYVDATGQGNLLVQPFDLYSGSGMARPETAGVASLTLRKLTGTPVPDVEAAGDTAWNDILVRDLSAGLYEYHLSAPRHDSASGQIEIKPGVTETLQVMLTNTLITIEWEVKPITIQDQYEVVLTANYETSVPVPVLVLTPISISLAGMKPGEVMNGELLLENKGLIRADSVKFYPPEGGDVFTIEFLAFPPESLEANQFVRLPYRLTRLGQASGKSDGKNGQALLAGGCGCKSFAGQVDWAQICMNGIKMCFGIPLPAISAECTPCPSGPLYPYDFHSYGGGIPGNYGSGGNVSGGFTVSPASKGGCDGSGKPNDCNIKVTARVMVRGVDGKYTESKIIQTIEPFYCLIKGEGKPARIRLYGGRRDGYWMAEGADYVDLLNSYAEVQFSKPGQYFAIYSNKEGTCTKTVEIRVFQLSVRSFRYQYYDRKEGKEKLELIDDEKDNMSYGFITADAAMPMIMAKLDSGGQVYQREGKNEQMKWYIKVEYIGSVPQGQNYTRKRNDKTEWMTPQPDKDGTHFDNYNEEKDISEPLSKEAAKIANSYIRSQASSLNHEELKSTGCVGGKATLKVQFYNGCIETGDEFIFHIRGSNPTRFDEVENYLDYLRNEAEKKSKHKFSYIKQICWHESGYRQFEDNVLSEHVNWGPEFEDILYCPLFGGPNGWGIGQIDFGAVNNVPFSNRGAPALLWDWKLSAECAVFVWYNYATSQAAPYFLKSELDKQSKMSDPANCGHSTHYIEETKSIVYCCILNPLTCGIFCAPSLVSG